MLSGELILNCPGNLYQLPHLSTLPDKKNDFQIIFDFVVINDDSTFVPTKSTGASHGHSNSISR